MDLQGFEAEALGAGATGGIKQGLARREEQRTVIPRNLSTRLRARELEAAAGPIASRTGPEYRPAIDGDRVSGNTGAR